MPAALKPFHQVDLPTGTTTLYTAPAATTTDVLSCVFCNKTGTDRTVSVTIVKSGGSPTLQILSLESVPANSALELIQGKGIVLATGDAIKALASAASAVDVYGSVVEET